MRHFALPFKVKVRKKIKEGGIVMATVKVKDLLKTALLEKVKEENQNKGLRVSELSLCIVKAIHSFNNEEPRIDEEKLFILEIGSNLHKMLQEYLQLEDVEKEFVRSYKGYKIIGHIDGILTHQGEKFLVEFKTIADKIYRNGKTSKDYLPNEHHIIQVSFYMRMANIKKAKLIYLLKSSGEIVEFDVEYTKEQEEKILKILDETISVLKGEKNIKDYIPKDDKDAWKCKYCFYSHLCSRLQNSQEVDVLKELENY